MTTEFFEKNKDILNQLAYVWIDGLREQLKVPEDFVYFPRTTLSVEIFNMIIDNIQQGDIIYITSTSQYNDGSLTSRTLEAFVKKDALIRLQQQLKENKNG